MKTLHITFGKSVAAYAGTRVAAGLDINDHQALADIANNLVFDPEWDTAEQLRVVSITDADTKEILAEDIDLEPDMRERIAYTGGFQLGDEYVQIEFVAPKHATDAEKDLAFFHALCQKADVNYLAVGDLPASSGEEDDE